MPPQAPAPQEPAKTWEHRELYENVVQAIAALPGHFQSETNITGILAPDLHTLNTVLGAAIEEQTVASLNTMRTIWDPDGDYALYRFVRQPTTFPDVLLRRAEASPGDPKAALMGIELKGWYVLAKEQVPTFRYVATPAASTIADLLVVVPWALSQVISGRPRVFTPHIMPARYAAEYRNYWWQHIRKAGGDTTIMSPENVKPYTRGQTDDRAVDDAGGNFGRIARTGLLDNFIRDVNEQLLCGVRVEKWLSFFKSVADPEKNKGGEPAPGRAKPK